MIEGKGRLKDKAAPAELPGYGRQIAMRHYVIRRNAQTNEGSYPVDACFPRTLEGITDTASVDEGSADLLYGLVRALRPLKCLETGTHKGRSTRAIASALLANSELDLVPVTFTGYFEKGHLWTIDEKDYGVMTSGALRDGETDLVTAVVGTTPGALALPPFDTLEGIDFAFLDGDHTPEGLDAELTYVDLHRAKQCLVAIDNSRDPGWPGVKRTLEGYHKYPRISLWTCTGLDLIWMSG